MGSQSPEDSIPTIPNDNYFRGNLGKVLAPRAAMIMPLLYGTFAFKNPWAKYEIASKLFVPLMLLFAKKKYGAVEYSRPG